MSAGRRYDSSMSRRVPVALIVVVLLGALGVTTASAAPKKKVRIETEPAGASVYLNAVEDGESCKTPCTVEVDADMTVIIDLAGYKPVVEQIAIARREKAPYTRSYTLVQSLGKIVVEGPPGAAVTVDDAAKGTAPVEIELPTGTYAVVVTLDGKQVYAQPVEVVANDTVSIAPSATSEPPSQDPPKPGKSGKRRRGGGAGSITKRTAARGGTVVTAAVDMGIGFRDFTYDNVDVEVNPDLNPENEKGQLLAGPVVEMWPGRLLGVDLLDGFSIVGRYQLGLNSQVVKTDTDVDTAAKTQWSSYELSARQRWTVGALAIEAGVGYVVDQHQFEGEDADIAKVPDASYESMRLGGRGSYRIGTLEPYVAAETRVVLSGGPLEDRFEMDGASISGLRGALGITSHMGSITGRLEATLTRYTWTFDNKLAAGTDGATDSIKLVSLVIGYSY
jgi:hypothetical protein